MEDFAYKTLGIFPILTFWKGYELFTGKWNHFYVEGRENLQNGGILLTSHFGGGTPYFFGRAAFPKPLHWVASRTLWLETFSWVLGHKPAFQKKFFDNFAFRITDFTEIALTELWGRRPFMPWFLDKIGQIPCGIDLKEYPTLRKLRINSRPYQEIQNRSSFLRLERVIGSYLKRGGIVAFTANGHVYQKEGERLCDCPETLQSGAVFFSQMYDIPIIPGAEIVNGNVYGVRFGEPIRDHLNGRFPQEEEESNTDYRKRLTKDLFAKTIDDLVY